MPRVSAAFFLVGVLLVLFGMCLGEYMDMHTDFTLMPVHAHANLLGWVTLALFGTFYALTKETYSPRLAWLNFILSAGGVLITLPLLAYLLMHPEQGPTLGPITGAAAGITILGMLVFLLSVWREFTRKRG